MKISIILPTIHPLVVYDLIESFTSSYSGEWEFIIIGPHKLPSKVISKWGQDNIKTVYSFASPVKCQQIGLMHCSGDYITRAVDDSLYGIGTMDAAMLKSTSMNVVNLKFTESNKYIDLNHKDCQQETMAKDEFYHLQYHNQTLMPYVPASFQVINFGIYPRDILMKVGGWDCQFEGIAIAELDLSIRLQFYGIKPLLTDNIILKCGWTPGEEGDHGPMHHAFYADMEKYKTIYSDISYEKRITISPDNYISSPDKWARRFG